MARIEINDLDSVSTLDEAALDTVVGGAANGSGSPVPVSDLLPEAAFPALGTTGLGL